MPVTIEMSIPSWVSGEISCTAPGQSGATYYVASYSGGPFSATITVDMRDVLAVQQLGFVTTGTPSES